MANRKKERIITAEEAEMLLNAREQINIVVKARKKCKEIVSAHASIKSPRLDGLPRSEDIAYGLDGSTVHAEALLSCLEREESRLAYYQDEAYKIIVELSPVLHEFCMYYYISGMTMQKTADAMYRCKEQCFRYRKKIEQALEE